MCTGAKEPHVVRVEFAWSGVGANYYLTSHCRDAELGGTCAFIDAEHALDVQYASRLGINLEDTNFSA